MHVRDTQIHQPVLLIISGLLLAVEGGTRIEREKMCYQMNTSLQRYYPYQEHVTSTHYASVDF
jgi:hypothetical protein